MTSTDTATDETAVRHGARKLLVKLLCFAIVMLFAGLTSAYIVSRGNGYWVWVNLPQAFIYSTAAIVLSSALLQWGYARTKAGQGASTGAWLTASTLVLGLVFTFFQFQGFQQLIDSGNTANGSGGILNLKGTYWEDYELSLKGKPLVLENGNFYLANDETRQTALNADIAEQFNAGSSYLYVLTVVHWAHLALGLLALLVMVVKGFQGRYTATEHVGHWGGTVYWHFLGGLWVFLFLFFQLMH